MTNISVLQQLLEKFDPKQYPDKSDQVIAKAFEKAADHVYFGIPIKHEHVAVMLKILLTTRDQLLQHGKEDTTTTTPVEELQNG